MTDLNGSPPETPTPPTAASNLKNGMVQAKLKVIASVLLIGAILVVFMFTRKDKAVEQETEVSRVTMSGINLEEDDVGAGAQNPEVDALIAQDEAQRERAAITDGSTYIAPVPVLDEQPEKAPSTVQAPSVYVPTVSVASQQAKLAALQGLDERLYGAKPAVVTEVQFVKPESPDVSPTAPADGASAEGESDTASRPRQEGPVHKQYPAGTVWFATTLTAIDSDVPGPIKARIEQGPFAGGEVLGSYEVRGRKYVTMSFTRVVHKGVEYSVDAVGLNPNNGVAGLEGDVNNHWGQRLILPTLAAAIGKYAEAATFGGVTVTSAAGAIVQEPSLSGSEQVKYALGSGVSEGITPVIRDEAAQIQRQVTLPQNTSFGLMLIEGI